MYRDEDTGVLTISAYLAKAPASGFRRSLSSILGVAVRDVSVRRLPRQNWATSWRRHFHPLEVGNRLLIKPSWSRRRARLGQRVIILNPGLSFGTGQHPTTSFCLRQLARCRIKGLRQSFLDVGTGSGILALAAVKLGYSSVEAFDFDPEAVRAAQRNARRNRINSRLSIQQRDLIALSPKSFRRYDVICANVTYDLLVAQAKKLSQLLSHDGRLIVAGILEEQFPIVTKSFQGFGLTLVRSELNDIWRSGQFAFPGGVQRGKA